jgi:xanthine dehydrogenase molybdenum-binding subunit
MVKKFRHIGIETPRIAAREFVTGRAKYIGDMKLQHMLYGKILRSPYPHANIKSIDTAKAEAYPGVGAILTYKNAPNWMFGIPFRHIRILDSKVRFVGDAVAMVAAQTESIAEEALELIDVEYEILPSVCDIEEAMKPDAPQLYDEFPNNIVPNEPIAKSQRTQVELDIGDTEQGFKDADFIVEATAKLENLQNPMPPEPPGAIAQWEDGRVTVWGSFQSTGMTEMAVRQVAGLQQGDVRIISAFVGGSYGSKNTPFLVALGALALAKAARRPVCLLYSKEEHFASYQVRMGSRANYKIGIKKDGTVTALAGDWLCDCGPQSTAQGMMVSVGLTAPTLLIKCENMKIDTKCILTNNVPSGAYRGFGYMENTALVSSALFMALEKANIDPIRFFKNNLFKTGDRFYNAWQTMGWVNSKTPDFLQPIEKGAKLFGWNNRWKGWGKPTDIRGTRRRAVGVGLACNIGVGEMNSTVNVLLGAFGSVTIHSSAVEFGTGARDVVSKVAAETLDVPLERVHITPPDSSINPWEWGSTGSRSTYAMGAATLAAAENAKRQLFKRAAPFFGPNTKPEDLETKDGMVLAKGSEAKMPWIAIIGYQGSITGTGYYPSRYDVPSYLMIFVEVEVDTETGESQLLKALSVTDCGTVVNPLAFQGQLQGYIPGADIILTEETVVNKSTGHILNPNMIDYKWRSFMDLPAHQLLILETIPEEADPPCPFGARGGGETALTPTAPATIMAMYNAIGKWVYDFPMTPDKILKALGKI